MPDALIQEYMEMHQVVDEMNVKLQHVVEQLREHYRILVNCRDIQRMSVQEADALRVYCSGVAGE